MHFLSIHYEGVSNHVSLDELVDVSGIPLTANVDGGGRQGQCVDVFGFSVPMLDDTLQLSQYSLTIIV